MLQLESSKLLILAIVYSYVLSHGCKSSTAPCTSHCTPVLPQLATLGKSAAKLTLDTLLAPPRGFNSGDIDFLHRHHRVKSTFCLGASCR